MQLSQVFMARIKMNENLEIGNSGIKLKNLSTLKIKKQVIGIALNTTNQSLNDTDIIGAKQVIIYYQIADYKDSMTVPSTMGDCWFRRCIDNCVLHVWVNFEQGTILTSPYNSGNIAIVGYDIISN